MRIIKILIISIGNKLVSNYSKFKTVLQTILTPDFELMVLLGFQQRVRKAMPRKLLSELRQNIMGHKAYCTHQCIENIT